MSNTFQASRDIIVRTDKWSEASNFYGKVLGFPITERAKTIVGFETGAFCLYVERGKGHGPVFDFLVPDIQEAKRQLVAAGCTIIEENPAVPRCYIKDPYGLVFNVEQSSGEKWFMQSNQSIDWKDEWFPIDDVTYLNFAAHAAIPRVALNAVQLSVAAKMRPHIVDDRSFFSIAASLRQTLATLIGASPDEIALTSGAGAGLAAIAYALKWSAGDEVIIARGEFPVQYATWKPMEAREGIKVRIAVPQGQFIQSDDLVAAMTPNTRVVSVSHVRFDDGSMLDVSSLAAACKRNGTLLVLDVSQSCGAIPMNVRSLGADFIVCAGYKYLLSPWGTGFLWTRKENLDSLRPGPYNWLSQGVESFARLNYVDPEPAPTLSRWDSAEAASIYNFNLTVMEASAKFVLDASPALIRDHNQALIDYFFERLPEGYRLASPRQASQRGVFGCIEVGSRSNTESVYQTLRDERFVVALREGKIRVAPHLLNSTEDIDRLLFVMEKAQKEARHVPH